MPTTITIRDIPDDLRRRIEARAALRGTSVSELVLAVLQDALAPPTRAELLARITRRPVRELDPSPTEILRNERGDA